MKIVLVLLTVGLCAVSASSDIPLWKKQKDVLLLLGHINQQVVYKDWKDIIESWNVSQHVSDFSKPEVVQDFELYYPNDILPQGKIFSVMYSWQLKEAIMLFKLFYYANTYTTFYNTAVWARQHFNEALFLYSYSLAVVHRPDMQGVALPPIYEIYPQYFYDVAAVQQAYYYKQVHNAQHPMPGYNQQYGYTVLANYSGYYLNLHPEQSLSYYLEDVGINAYHYYFNLYYPFWMSSTEFGFSNINRGMQYIFFYQQLLARFYLERISNGLGEIPYLDIDLPVITPYYPSLEYPNGLEFPTRAPFVKLSENYYNHGQEWAWKGLYGYSPKLIQEYSSRLTNVVDQGYVYVDGQKISLQSPQGLNILGNLIQANPDSPDSHFYGYIWLYASHLLGYSFQPLQQDNIVPSALEHFETAMRDPMFYQIYKRLLLSTYRYLYQFPPHTTQDLVFPGVEITNVKVDKLITYNEYVYSDMSNAVFLSQEELLEDSFHIRVGQEKLNHKPFNYQITVKSNHDTKAVVKIFLAPTYNQYKKSINITENLANMVLLDYFVQNLKSGETVINHNSHDSQLYGDDLLSAHQLYQQMDSTQHGKGESPTVVTNNYYSFPQRYMLPQGSTAGVPYSLYFFIYPYVSSNVQQSGIYDNYFYPYEGETQFYDNYSLLFPFDKPIVHEHLWWNIPNLYEYETKVYHVDDMNVVH